MTKLGMNLQPEKAFKVKPRHFLRTTGRVLRQSLWITFRFQITQLRDLMLRRPCQIILADMVVVRRRLALEVGYQS